MQTPLSIRVDLGPIGNTAASPHRVIAENGSKYLMKGGTFAKYPNPYIALNEWVAAEFCKILGYPTMNHRLLVCQGIVYFGSEWMEPTTFKDSWPRQNLRNCCNMELLYDVLAFDTWLCNVDRHAGNLVVRIDDTGVESLLMNDHDLCIFPPGTSPANISNENDRPPYKCTRLPYITTEMADAPMLRQAINRIQAIPQSDIRGVIKDVPLQWLNTNDRKLLVEFLLLRQSRLYTVFIDARRYYPNLIGSL